MSEKYLPEHIGLQGKWIAQGEEQALAIPLATLYPHLCLPVMYIVLLSRMFGKMSDQADGVNV